MMHWIAIQMALLDTQDTRFVIVSVWLLLMAVLAWTIGRGRKRP